jgi:hypothetical protein
MVWKLISCLAFSYFTHLDSLICFLRKFLTSCIVIEECVPFELVTDYVYRDLNWISI